MTKLTNNLTEQTPMDGPETFYHVVEKEDGLRDDEISFEFDSKEEAIADFIDLHSNITDEDTKWDSNGKVIVPEFEVYKITVEKA